MIPLVALDICRLQKRQNPRNIIWQTIKLAGELDKIGYYRYWLGEHHSADIAQSSPEILLPVLAGSTDRIRVGTAGILLRLYSPLKVAKNFRLLESLFPSRIDLGLARGTVIKEVQPYFRMAAFDNENYEKQVLELLSFMRDETMEVVANPQGIPSPEIWLLGSRTETMRIAARSGTAFCLSMFLEVDVVDPQEIISIYRKQFVPSRELLKSKCSVALAGICAETSSKAAALMQGFNSATIKPILVGSQEECRRIVTELHKRLEVDEIVFLDLSERYSDRLRSYHLLYDALRND